MIIQITDHILAAQNRLIQQYKDSTNLKGLIEDLFGTQVQEIENVFWDLLSRLDINTMVGRQLDNIGSIVGQARNGQTDIVYRLFIQAKIGVNVSESEASRIIDVWKLITQANLVHMFEAFPAEVDLYADVALDPALVDLAFALMQNVVGAGIAVGFVGGINNTDDFGFEGSVNSLGFGSALSQGTNTSTSTNKLIDSGATFQTDLVDNTMMVYNTDEATVANIVSVDSEIQLTLDADIFASSPNDYYVNEDVGGKLSYIQAPRYYGELTSDSSLWGAAISVWHFNENNKDAKGDNHGSRFGSGTAFDTVNQKLGSAAALFNEIDDYVAMGSPANLNFDYNEPFSFSILVRKSSLGSFHTLFAKADKTSDVGYYLVLSSANKLLFFLTNTAATNQIYVSETIASITNINQWYHVVLTYDGSTNASGVHIYVDAVDKTLSIINDNLSATTQTSKSFQIGVRDATEAEFHGLIDEVAAFNVELSGAQVAKLNDEQIS